MKKRRWNGDTVFAAGFLGIIALGLVVIGMRYLTAEVLVKSAGMENAFTDWMLFDMQNKKIGDRSKQVKIKWAELYPFDSNNPIQAPDKGNKNKQNAYIEKYNKYNKRINKQKKVIDKYTSEYIPFYQNIVEAFNQYEEYIGWDFIPYKIYKSGIILEEGYISGRQELIDINEAANAVIDLAAFANDNGAKFLYAQIPTKISKKEDVYISGVFDFSNQIADRFLDRLKKHGVTTYDHRQDIVDEGLNHHDLCFKTDHHWKPETGLWAAKNLLAFVNKQYKYHLNDELLRKDNFEKVVYKNCFLGSRGRKVTISRAEPEDISLLYPQFNTLVHFQIPSLGLNEVGSFDVMYNMSVFDEKNLYNQNRYWAYSYGSQSFTRIENKLLKEGPRVLVIKKSFSNVVVPFMALCVKNLDAIDLRHFDGSLQTFIKQEKPDLVILTYEYISGVNYSNHKHPFDFR